MERTPLLSVAHPPESELDETAASPAPLSDPFAPAPDDPPFAEYEHLPWRFRKRLPVHLWGYVVLEVLRVAILGILAVSLLYSAIAAYQTMRSGIQLTFIWPFLVRTVAYPLYFSIPLSLLFGVTLALGRMVADMEVSAMRCHGASHAQLFAPVAALALAGLVASDHVNSRVAPELHYEKRNLQQYIIKQLENLGAGRNRTILLPGGGGSLLVGAYEGTDLWKVEIDLNRSLQSRFVPTVRAELPSKLPEKVTLVARTGRLEIPDDRRAVIIHLRGVEILVPESAEGGERFHQRFTITETLSIPLSFENKSRGLKDLDSNRLAGVIGDLEERLEGDPDDADAAHRLHAAVTEKHRRLAFSLSAMTFPFIGACLCFLLHGRNRLLPFFLGNVVVLAIYYPLLIVGSFLAERGFFPGLSMALPNVALLALGIALLRKVVRL